MKNTHLEKYSGQPMAPLQRIALKPRNGNSEEKGKSRINANQGSSWQNFDLVDTLELLERSFADFNPVDKEATLRGSFSQGLSLSYSYAGASLLD